MQLEILDQYLAFVFKNPDPFGEKPLQESLTKKGFKVPARPPPGLISVTIGPPIVAVGKDARISYDPEVGFLAVNSGTTAKMVEIFRELPSILETDVLPRWKDVARGIEFTLMGRVTGDAIPMQVISAFAKPLDMTVFSEIVGVPVTLGTIRLVPAGLTQGEDNLRRVLQWFELRIEPWITNPISYLVNVVYRDPSLDKVVKFAEDSQAFIYKAIETLENSYGQPASNH